LSRGWRLAAVVREGLANFASSGARLVVLGLGIGGLLGALFWAELSFTGDVKEQARRFDAAGGRVVVVDAPNGLDAARCDELRWDPHVVAAGGFRNGGGVVTSNSPGTFFARFEVTGDISSVWDPGAAHQTGAGYLVGLAAARELGLADGSWLWLEDEGGAPVAILDPARRNEFASRAILDPVAPTGRLAQCWVEFLPQYYETGLLWLPAHFAADEAEARRAVSRGEFGVDPGDLLAGRPQRWGWLPAGIVGAALVTLMALFRRSEAAVYRAFGLPRSGLLIMHETETIVLVLGSLAIGALWATAVHSLTAGLPGADQLWLAFRTAGLAAAVVVILGPLGALVAGMGSPAALLKER
jgi:hypothetical protein